MYYLNYIYLISELSDIIFITEMIEKSCMYFKKFSLNSYNVTWIFFLFTKE